MLEEQLTKFESRRHLLRYISLIRLHARKWIRQEDKKRKWYRFNTLAQAQACLEGINSNSKYPIRGVYRGKPAPDSKQKTERWAECVFRCADGKYGFEELKDDHAKVLGIDKGSFTKFYGTVVEEYISSWKPEAVK